MTTKVKLIADGAITPDQITLTTASAGTNTTAPATTAFVQQEITSLVDSSPAALNTLNELAAALGDDANFSTTVTNSIALKAPLASPTFTGTVEIPNLTISSAQGSDGQVLTSTGSGIAWEDAAGGGVDGIVSSADATAITIDSSENVGIGTGSPQRKLDVLGTGVLFANTSGTHEILFGDTAHRYFGLYTPSSPNYMSIRTGTTELLTVTSAGNVGIGTSSPSTDLHIKSTDQNALTVETDTAVNQIHLSNSTNSPTYITQDSYVLKLKADDNAWGGTASGIHFRVKNAEYARVTPKGLSIGDTDGDYENRNGSEGLHVKRGGILMNGPPGDANMSSDTNGNQWTYHGQGGRGGNFTSVYFSIPNPNTGASGVGYGGFSVEFYIAGYNSKYHSGHYSGYVNNGITQSAAAFYATSGSASIAAVSVGSQGFKITVSFPSMTHPTAKFVVNKGGHGGSAGNTAYTDMSGAQIGWA